MIYNLHNLLNLLTCFPRLCGDFEDSLTKFAVTGSQLKRIFGHIMRPENRADKGECYQVSRGVRAVYNSAERRLESLTIRGMPVVDEQTYSICLTSYHLRNSAQLLNVTYEELAELRRPRVVATSMRDVLEEHLRNNQNLNSKVEGRLVYK